MFMPFLHIFYILSSVLACESDIYYRELGPSILICVLYNKEKEVQTQSLRLLNGTILFNYFGKITSLDSLRALPSQGLNGTISMVFLASLPLQVSWQSAALPIETPWWDYHFGFIGSTTSWGSLVGLPLLFS